MKVNAENKSKEIFRGSCAQITTNGKHPFGAPFGSDKYKDGYLASKVDEWVTELGVLLENVKTHLQAAFSDFTTEFWHKLYAYHLGSINKTSTNRPSLSLKK